jgi:hypothetical protein
MKVSIYLPDDLIDFIDAKTDATINSKIDAKIDNRSRLVEDILQAWRKQQEEILVDQLNEQDETPNQIVIQGIQQGLYEALTGQTIPLSEMWEGIDA